MSRRKLEELNLLDDFLFGSMLTYPGIGEKFIRLLLETIFHKEFGKLTIVPQKVYYGSDTDRHGARLDVYLEENEENISENAQVYDVEPDRNDDSEAVEVLPKRVRFYHAKIDSRSLRSGESYRLLKNVIVVMIMSYDPFGLNRMVYTIKNKCDEVPSMPYDDGAVTLFLYTRGIEGEPEEELRQLLRYMEHTTKENAKNATLRNIQEMVEKVKQDGEVELEYMKIFEREEMLIKQGRKEEMVNTERERARADEAEARAAEAEMRAAEAEKELRCLKEEIERLKNNK